jgi:hypothetical protein
MYKILFRKVAEKKRFGDLDLEWRITLNWMLKYEYRLWFGLKCRGIGFSAEIL